MNKDFGPFELKEKIGSGGMASVYLAVQKSLSRPVVLKLLYPHLAEDEKLVQRFEREARAAAMMRHENIIQVIDCGRHEDVAYIAMEFVEGMDLRKWLDAHGTPPIEMGILMLRDLCRGLEHAHGHHIVHRDIKPANVMLTPDGTIKLMDFGLARSGADTNTQMTLAGSVMGTPAYMSPEQATGEVVDERSDIFSAGVLAYELLGGRRPFLGDSYSTVLRSVLTVEPPDVTELNPLVPEEVARIVRGMLQKDVSKRYASIGVLREALEDVIEQMGLTRGKDLLREYVRDPDGVAPMWRRKRMSRHMDQGLYYENMGLGKIDDALIEFRRVLYLDPENAKAREHVKKLEHDRDKVSPPAPPAGATPAASSGGDDKTIVLAPGQATPAPPVTPAPRVTTAPQAKPDPRDDRTIVQAPGGSAQSPASPPPPAPPAAPGPAASRRPPPPPPAPSAPASRRPPPGTAVPKAAPSRKPGPPVPLIAGLGAALIVAVIAVVLVMRKGPETGGGAAAPSTDLSQSAPVAPEVLPPAPASPAAPVTAESTGTDPLTAARTAFDAARYADAVLLAKQALAKRDLSRKDQRTARELLARAYVRDHQPSDAARAFSELLKSYPAFRPDASFLSEERGAFETARLNFASARRETLPAAHPAAPASGAGTATVNVKVSPFAQSFVVDGRTEDGNKKLFHTRLPAGPHSIEVRHPSLGSKQWKFDLKAGETKDLTYDFTASAGSISVASEPTWADIYLDGVRVGHPTPWDITSVTAGRHEVSLVREGWAVEGAAQTVDVKAGDSKVVKFKLKQQRR